MAVPNEGWLNVTNVEKTRCDGARNRARSVLCSELRDDRPDSTLDCLAGEVNMTCDLCVRRSRRGNLEDLNLSWA
jgi:hypothetical protein